MPNSGPVLIQVDLAEYEALKQTALKMDCLREAGVDNWEGYAGAMQRFNAELVARGEVLVRQAEGEPATDSRIDPTAPEA